MMVRRHGVDERVRCEPGSFAGLVYWYSLWPVHDDVFGGMLQPIAAASAVT